MDNNTLESRLSRIDERTLSIQSMLEMIMRDLRAHDERLDRLEQWQNRIIGAIGILAFVVSLVATCVKFRI
ncbi:MAG: hypothetical protein N3G75_06265 [Methanothrix sp.]|nr:hypothetical protein [Methanothrix sp.]MCX8207419.1 hypothetical protein [Methanothrix sp.]